MRATMPGMSKIKIRLRLAVLIQIFAVALIYGGGARAEELPRWELGLGVGGVYVPDYRGADEARAYVVPWPYVVYRGSRFNLDREGLQGRLFGSTRLSIVASINASTPADSSQNVARAGMPDLDFAFEVGPMLEVNLWREPVKKQRVALQLPLRAVVVSDFRRFDDAGWIFAPRLLWQAPYFQPGDIDVDVTLGPLFASDAYHDYYYRVEPQYATVTRPAYDAVAGYSGSRLTVGVAKRKRQWWWGAYVRYDNLAGATFIESPLIRARESWVAGGGLAYVFARSRATRTPP